MNSNNEPSRVVVGDGPVHPRTARRLACELGEKPPLPPEVADRVERLHARNRLGAPLLESVAVHTHTQHARARPVHILAGVLTASGLLLLALGAIQSSAAVMLAGAVVAAAGVAGWVRTGPVSLPLTHPGAAPLFDEEALAAFDAAAQATAEHLSDEAAALVVQIKEMCVRLGPLRPAHDEHFTLEDRLFLRECLRRYLPDSLEAFLRVPAAQRQARLYADQPSAAQALLQQVALLHEQMLQREKKIGRSAAEHLMRQQRFLESKKSR